MRASSSVALCLLLAAAPALAGNDFCDGGGKTAAAGAGEVPQDPAGGSCEVDMIVTDRPQSSDDAYWRMRDLPFTRANVDVLKASDAWPELPLDLMEAHLPGGYASKQAVQGPIDPPIGEPGGAYGESTFLEWSFRPEGIRSDARVLTLSALADGRATYLRVDWLEPPRPDWSYADPATAPAPQTLDSRLVRLYAGGAASPQRITLLHDGAYVRVGLGLPVRQWISFALPDQRWLPQRLRNGPVKGSPLSQGMGLRVDWPSLRPGTLNRDAQGIARPQPDPDPATPRRD